MTLAAAFAVVATALILLARQRTQLDSSSTDDVEVAAQPGVPELRMPTERGNVRLAPVAVERELHSAGATTADAVPAVPTSRPVFGKYRVTGRVIDVEDRPFHATDAVVRVYGEDHAGHDDVVLGTAAVSASGHFWIDLRRSRRNAALHDASGHVWVRLVAPGYESADAGGDLSEAVGGVLTLDLETSRGGLMARGRIVDSAGVPVPEAGLHFVQWGPLGDDIQNEDLLAESDGRFDFQIDTFGWIDVVAVHPSLGVVKAGGRLDPGMTVFDFGDLVLEERGVVSGIVRGYGGNAIASYYVALTPVIDDDYIRSHEVASDAQGRFRFANLDDVAYHVSHEFTMVDTESCPIVRPDTTGYVVKVEHPTARVTIVDPDGVPITADGFACRFVPEATSKGQNRWIDIDEPQPGVHRIIFDRAGKFAIGAHIHVDGQRWSATRVVNIRREHLEIELRLLPDEGHAVRFIVHGTQGDAVTGWRARVIDPRTNMRIGRASHGSDTLAVMPGTWTVNVEPREPSTFLAFSTEFEVPKDVPDGPLVVHAHAKQDGGRLRLSVRATDDKTKIVFVSVVDEHGQRFGKDVQWKLGGAPSDFKPTLPVGRYTLVLRNMSSRGFVGTLPMASFNIPGFPQPTRQSATSTETKVEFTIRAGDVTTLDLAFP